MFSSFSVGLGGSVHDFATVVADHKSVLWGIEDERVTRVRHSLGATDPIRPSFDLAQNTFPEIGSSRSIIVANDVLATVPIVRSLNAELMNHHLSHAYSVFFTSRFDEAVIVVIDGAGSITNEYQKSHTRETTSVYFGQGNYLKLLSSINGSKKSSSKINAIDFPASNSLGGLYELATVCCGYSPLQTGRTMALASYGDDRFLETFKKRIDLFDGAGFSVNVHGRDGFKNLFSELSQKYGTRQDVPFEIKASIARATQEVVEAVLQHILKWAFKETGCKNLCIAGGVALNATAMGKLGDISAFNDFSVISSPGDSGTAIGAAIYGQMKGAQGIETRRWHMSPYLGPEQADYCDTEARLELVRKFTNIQNKAAYVSNLLKSGNVVACFIGRSEFGPRALGNRSILAHPNSAGITSKLNNLKNREWFRPVSPAALLPAREGYQQGEIIMQYARPLSNSHFGYKSCFHVDGSSRVQIVTRESHYFLWEVLQCLKRDNCNAVLNTSFNIEGEPIVETRADAVSTFERSKIDFLMIEDCIYRRKTL